MPQAYHDWTPVITTHALLAVIALLLGAILLAGRKGHRVHRILGWAWVICMACVAMISFSIHRPGGFSWIHGLSVFTLVMLTTGVLFARKHRVGAHRRNMIGLYFCGLLITGLFTLLPDRLIGRALHQWLGGF